MSINFTLSSKLFMEAQDINILPGKRTNAMAPLGIGFAPSHYRGGARTPAKLSAVAKLLDYIFETKSVSAIASDTEIYGEYCDGTDYTRFTCDGKTAIYEGERLHGNLAVLPFMLFALRNSASIPEFKDAFTDVRKCIETGADEKEMMKAVAYFCDVYYYAIAKHAGDVVVHEKALKMDDVKQKAKDGDFGPIAVFSGMVQPKMTGVETGKAKREKVARPTGEDFFSRIKAGEYTIPYEWDEKQRTRIPAKASLDSFIPSETYYSLVSKIKTRLDKVVLRMDSGMTGAEAIGRDHVELFITGKPGTGKTTLAYALGAATGMPVYTVAMTKNTEEDVFQGMNKVVDGALKFVSTDFLDAYTNGGIIILEEINLPDPSVVMGAIGQAVEFPFILMKDGYVPVKRHPMCVIIGTMNIGTFGSKGVNQALSSRFRQSYILNDPTKEDFIKILTSTGAKKREANWVFTAYQKITDYLKSPSVNAEDVCLNVTLRGCIGALENISEGENAKEAIRNTLVGKISEVDLALAEDVYKNVVQSLPEL